MRQTYDLSKENDTSVVKITKYSLQHKEEGVVESNYAADEVYLSIVVISDA